MHISKPVLFTDYVAKKELKNSKISRAGRTQSYWRKEESTISFNAFPSLAFYLSIASKGGGTTDIKLDINEEDVVEILQSIAQANPEMFDTFLKCASIARDIGIQDLNSEIEELNSEMGDEISKRKDWVEAANLLSSSADIIHSHLDDQYMSKLEDDDEDEKELYEKMDEIRDFINELANTRG